MNKLLDILVVMAMVVVASALTLLTVVFRGEPQGVDKQAYEAAKLKMEQVAGDKPERYIVEPMGPGLFSANQIKGKVIKKLKHSNKYVVKMTDTELKQMTSFGALAQNVKVSKDTVVTLPPVVKGKVATSSRPSIFSCEKEPEPSDPTQPPKQPKQRTPWGIERIHADQAHTIGMLGEGVVVAVIDTGIDCEHPDLEGQCIGGWNYVDGNDNYFDDNGHGSHCSGTIAALDNNIGVVGVAPMAKLWGGKVLDADGSGYCSDVADAIWGAIEAGVKVISMSLGGPACDAIGEAVVDAQAAGIQIIAAAGNSGGDVEYPAKRPQVIAISALDDFGDQLAYFSCRGPEVEYIAPGVSVESTTPGGHYEYFSGTSMATPHVAGVCALYLATGGSDCRNGLAIERLGMSNDYQGRGLVDALGSVQ